jgi:hypothetical protein
MAMRQRWYCGNDDINDDNEDDEDEGNDDGDVDDGDDDDADDNAEEIFAPAAAPAPALDTTRSAANYASAASKNKEKLPKTKGSRPTGGRKGLVMALVDLLVSYLVFYSYI